MQKITATTPDELAAWACPAIAWATLTSLTALIPSQAHWGGHAFTILAYVMYWIGVAWILLVTLAIFTTLFRTDVSPSTTVFPPAFCLPCVGLETVALSGAVIANYSTAVSAGLAVPAIIVSYFLAGMGIWLAVLVYAVVVVKLLHTGWPEPAKIPSLMLLVGPFGQAAATLQYLGRAADTLGRFAAYNRGTFLTASAAPGLSSASVLLALLIAGFDFFWLAIAIVAILDALVRRQLSFSLSSWGIIFPVGTTTTCFIAFSSNMDSPAFRGLATAFFVALFLVYCVCWGFTLFSLPGLLFQSTEKELARSRKREKMPKRVEEEEKAEAEAEAEEEGGEGDDKEE